MEEQRHARRHALTVDRDCTLGLIDFRHLEWSGHSAHLVDISTTGVGISSRDRIEPGIVWFKDRVGGHRSGLLMWVRRQGEEYRGGIKFVPLSRDEELYLQDQISWTRPHTPVRDAVTIIESVMESMKKEGRGPL